MDKPGEAPADQEEPIFHSYRVNISSKPGMYAQYDGYVFVHSPTDDPEELFTRAVKELARTSFSDRPSRDFWIYGGAQREEA